jgi:transcriptional regulator with XRE-family HTH domain
MEQLFNPEEFGRKVATALTRRGMTIRKGAEVLGISRTSLHRITQGTAPDVESYLRLLKWIEEPTDA